MADHMPLKRPEPVYSLYNLTALQNNLKKGYVSKYSTNKSKGGETTVMKMLSGVIGYNMINAIRDHVNKVGFIDELEELPILYRVIESTIRAEERKNLYG